MKGREEEKKERGKTEGRIREIRDKRKTKESEGDGEREKKNRKKSRGGRKRNKRMWGREKTKSEEGDNGVVGGGRKEVLAVSNPLT